MNRSTKATLLGILGGAAVSGAAGYGLSKKHKYRNAILSALAGGAVGGTVGRMANAHMDFMKRRAIARSSGDKPVPGSLYFVSHPDNSIDLSETSLPEVDAAAKRLKKLTGWNGKFKIGHAGLIAVDKNGNATRYDYGMYRGGQGSPVTSGTLKSKFSVKGMSPAEIAKLVQSKSPQWGKTVDLHKIDVDDIGIAGRYIDGLSAPGSDSFDWVPGGYSCSTVARNALEASRPKRHGITSYLMDYLLGGFPGSNAPYKSEHTRYVAD